MKRLQSLSYKTLFTILFFSLAGIIFFIRIGRPAQKVSAAWWDEMWHYRKAIQINNSGTNRTNIQFKLFTNYDLSSLVSAGKIQADLDDLRFTDINGNLLNYWIEDPTNNSADIWIVLNSLPNSGTTVYLYYGNSSATSGQTIMGKTPNNPGISCKAIQLSGGSDGVYYIDPTGLEATDAYQTYCDMSGNGGGWTLLMKSEGNTTTFNYNASYWTTTNTLNPNDTEINHNTDAKFESFNSLIIDQIRATWPSTGHTMVETISTTTALSLFQTTVDLGPSMAQFDYTNFPYQTGYQSYGFNLTCAAANKVRWGWMFNNETTCSSNDCSAGIGLMTVYSTTNGGYVTCCSSKPNGGYPYRVRIWGRENNIVTPNVSFINTTPQSEESSTAPIAYWKFDEGVGTTVYDSAGTSNGVFGTGSSSPNWADESQCISGKCLSFDGTNDYINNGNNVSLNPNNAITIEGWFYSNNFSQVYVPFAKNLQYRIHFHNTNNLYIDFYDAAGNRLYAGYSYSSLGITNSRWYHLAFSFDGYEVKTFVNGQYKNSKTGGTGGIRSDQGGNFYIGSDSGTQYFFNGKIDDIKIYPYARTAAQIKLDYNSRGSASSKGSSVNLGSNARNSVALSEGLVGYWKMDENTGTVVGDSSGVGNTGTFGIGDSAPGWTNGKYGIGISFDGVNDYINFGNPNLSSLTSASVSFWRKGPATPAGWLLFKGQSNSYYIMATSGGTGNFYHYNTGGNKIIYVDGNVVTAPPTDNNWHHYVISDVNFSSWTTLQLTNYPGWHFKGNIDEVRLYNRALSPAEVSALYNYAPGPIGYWDFIDGSGTTVNDKSGNNLTGTFGPGTSAPSWSSGKYGSGVNFSPTTKFINIPVNNSFQTNNSGRSFSYSLWFKSNDVSAANQYLITNNEPCNNPGSFSIALSSGVIYFNYYSISLPGSISHSFTPSITLQNNIWYHLEWTKTFGELGVKAYLNGISQTISGDNTATGNTTSRILLGAWNGTGSTCTNGVMESPPVANMSLKGSLDEVKIYNYIRTQKQIIEDMNAGAPATSAKSMVGYWKFDEGNGISAFNSGNGGTTLTSTLSGATTPSWVNDGKKNKALYFNGINSYVLVPKQIQDDFSISFWVKTTTTGNSGNWYAGKGLIDGEVGGVVNDFGTSLSGSKLAFGIGNPDTTIYSTSDINNGIWNHVTVTRSKNTGQIKIYINSKNEAIGVGNTNSLTATNNLRIGCIQTGIYFFEGSIDEVKIYNYVLTDEEIKQDYNAGSTIQFGSTSQSIGGTTTSLEYCIPGDTSPCSAPIAEWKMDEGVGTSITDTSGNSNTGTITGATWNQGKIGKGLKFNGSNNYVEVPSTPNATGTFTISTWVKAINGSSSDGYGYIIHRGSDYSIGGSVYFLGINPAGNYVGAVNGNHLNGDTGIAANENIWRFLTLSYDGNTQKVYVDGQLKSSYSLGAITNTTTGNKIGFGGTSLYLNYRNIKGQMDQVRVYNYARTPAQIAYDYNKGGPVGWWKFDECQGNIAYDWSGTGNTGTIVVGASGTQNSLGTCAVGTSAAWTNGASGKINSSLNFDGVDDKVALNPITNYLSGSFSYSAWIKLDTNVGAAVKNAISSEVSSYSNYWSVIGTYLNKWNFALYEGSNNPIAFSNDNFELNTWTHIVGVRDITTDKIYIYKNGVLQGNGTTDTTTSIPAYSAFNIGGQVNVANRYFPGQIDDVRIYNYALTEEQIKQIYNGGAVNFR